MDIRYILQERSTLRRKAAWMAVVSLVAFLGLTATSKASAAEWKVAGSPLTGSAAYATSNAGGLAFQTTFGGSPFGFTAGTVESLESTISNGASGATGTERLRFSNNQAVPSPCAVPTVTTVPLKTTPVIIKGLAYERIEAAEGTTLFTWTETKGSGACVLSGTYTVGGVLYARIEGIDDEASSHELKFSSAIQSQAGGELKFGSTRAYFTGAVVEKLTGSHAGQTWSATVAETSESGESGEPTEPEEHLGAPPQWKVAGSLLTGSATYATSNPGGLAFQTTFGGSPFGFSAGTVESLESTISNGGSGATGRERLRFSNNQAVPSPCAVPTVTTVPLTTKPVIIKGLAYERIEAAEGTTLFSWTETKGSGACVLSGTYTVTGVLYARIAGLTSEAATHELKFSSAIQSQAGGELKFGSTRAYFTGAVVQTLTGSHAGQSWSAY